MQDDARRINRLGLFSLFAGATAAVLVLSPPANADDTDAPPPIVVGGTVDTQASIVVDPKTPANTTGPIDPSKSIGVDTRTQPKPDCCVTWYPDANPPVFAVEQRFIDWGEYAYKDNYGRYWRYNSNVNPLLFEQIGGWPQPKPPPPPPPPDPRTNLGGAFGTGPSGPIPWELP